MKYKRHSKTILILSLLIYSALNSLAQKKTIIQIEKLTQPAALLPETSSKTIYDKFNIGLEKASVMPDSLVAFDEHPFLNGLVNAYQNHRPFIFSPDMFWVLISQGFARNVSNHTEELRSKLVGFEGKKQLTVAGENYGIQLGRNSEGWKEVFPDFSKQISNYSGKKLNEILTADFSTTTPTSKIVSQIAIMEAFKNYFDYKVTYIGCGLPYVTLEGSVADWKKLRQKTEALSEYKLDWWTKEIIPILDKLIEAKQGKTDTAFWKNTVKVKTIAAPYGPFDNIDGWITKFFPFDKKGAQRELKEIYSASNLASEIVKVPFILQELQTKTEYRMEFWAGFVGVKQNADDFSLKPELGWAVNNVAEQKLKEDTVKAQRLVDFSKSQQGKNNIKDTSNIITLNRALQLMKEMGLKEKLNKTLELKNIDEIPLEVFDAKHYKVLSLSFRGEIKIPEKLTNIKIDKLYLFGRIDKAEENKIVKMFPSTDIKFNAKDPVSFFR